MKKLLRRIVERIGYRYFKIAYQPLGLDHAHDVARFLGSASNVKVVFDVGANEGRSAEHYVHAFPCAQIYSIEPFASAYKSLVERVSEFSRVRTFQLAFADTNRVARIQSAEYSTVNSLRNELSNSSSSPDAELVTITTLGSFCAEQNISHVDFLKTDTEGFDLEVLKGAEAMLRSHKIQFILAEVSFDPDNTYREADRRSQIFVTSFFRLAEYLHDFGYHFVDVYDEEFACFCRPPIPFCNVLFTCAKLGAINVPAVTFRGA
jgi:FkbM family methyltransferase